LAAVACGFAPSAAHIVVTLMGGDVLPHEQPHPTWTSRFITERILEIADGFTSKTNYLIRAARFLLGDKPAVRIIWGVDPSIFKPTTVRDGGHFLFSPRCLQPLYNQGSILEAFALLAPRFPELKLVICGHGTDPHFKNELDARAGQLGIADKVTYTPSLSAAEMADLYSRSAAVVSVPLSDGFPQTVLESLACAAVCVVSELPRYEEFLSFGKDCLAVPPQNPAVLADTLAKVLRDDAYASQLRQNALVTATRIMHQDTESRRVHALYKAVAGKRHPYRFMLKAELLLLVVLHYCEQLFRRLFRVL
jgi:glycosyltransferase involved in cell wall biosynthesis